MLDAYECTDGEPTNIEVDSIGFEVVVIERAINEINDRMNELYYNLHDTEEE